jgi:hypothetical protein
VSLKIEMTDLHKLTDEQLVRGIRNAEAARESHIAASEAADTRSKMSREVGSFMTYPASTNLASKTWHDGKIVKNNNIIQRYKHELQRRKNKKQKEGGRETTSSEWCKRRPGSTGCTIMGGRRRTVRSRSRQYKKKTTRSRRYRSSSKK